MNIDPQEPQPVLVESESYMEETYDLLFEGLMELLNNKAQAHDHQYTDYLEAVNDKINYSLGIAKPEDVQKLETLRNTVMDTVLGAFKRDYGQFLDTDAVDQLRSPTFTRLVYYFFYLNKTANLREFLVNETISNRKKLAERFKKENKKDFAYTRLKSELQNIKNPNNIYVIMSYQEIANEAFSSNVYGFQDIINNTVLTFDQVQVMERIFRDFPDATSIYTTYVDGITEHDEYNHFLISFRDDLVRKMLSMS